MIYSVNDFNMYCSDTIARYNGESCFILGMMPDNKNIEIVMASNTKESVIVPCNKKLDLSSPPLGYITSVFSNTVDTCFLMRFPTRCVKVGICPANTNIPSRIFKTSQLKYFDQMFKGIYPSFDKAWYLTLRQGSSAFHRDFAIHDYDWYVALHHKGRTIGRISKKTREITLDSRFSYLNNQLQYILGGKYDMCA